MTPTIDGHQLTRVELTVPAHGIWTARVDFADAPTLSNPVTITLGPTKLVGTVTDLDGTTVAQRSCIVVGGYGGWSQTVEPRNFADTTGVAVRTIVDQIVSRNGEQIGQWLPPHATVGTHYVLDARSGLTHLDILTSGEHWVGYDGRTNVGARPSASIARYEVLAYDAQARCVELALDDLTELTVGVELSDRLDAPQTVREYRVTIDERGIRALCWSRGDGELAGLLRAIIRQEIAALVQPIRRYRVTKQTPAGLELQAVDRALGLPDIQPISVMGGAGVHADLTVGTHVLVAYEDNDRSRPIVVAFSGVDSPGFAPSKIVLGDSGQPAARKGDAVRVTMPVATFSAVIPPATTPVVCTVQSWTPTYADGSITAGSSLVEIG